MGLSVTHQGRKYTCPRVCPVEKYLAKHFTTHYSTVDTSMKNLLLLRKEKLSHKIQIKCLKMWFRGRVTRRPEKFRTVRNHKHLS